MSVRPVCWPLDTPLGRAVANQVDVVLDSRLTPMLRVAHPATTHSRVTACLAPGGPHEPRGYGTTGGRSPRMGSTMRHDSSIESSRANSVGSPLIASSINSSYGSGPMSPRKLARRRERDRFGDHQVAGLLVEPSDRREALGLGLDANRVRRQRLGIVMREPERRRGRGELDRHLGDRVRQSPCRPAGRTARPSIEDNRCRDETHRTSRCRSRASRPTTSR